MNFLKTWCKNELSEVMKKKLNLILVKVCVCVCVKITMNVEKLRDYLTK